MYCEIVVKNGGNVDEAGLKKAIGPTRLGDDIALAKAYGRSAIYSKNPPTRSIFAHEAVYNCFVIARKLNFRTSTYHLEGNTLTVTAKSMLMAVQEYCNALFKALATPPSTKPYKCLTLAVQLFEDNGRETGVEGRLITLRSILGKRLGWEALSSEFIKAATAIGLFYVGIEGDKVKAALFGLGVVIVFGFIETTFDYCTKSGKIEWKSGEY
jgi:hypothetical protein